MEEARVDHAAAVDASDELLRPYPASRQEIVVTEVATRLYPPNREQTQAQAAREQRKKAKLGVKHCVRKLRAAARVRMMLHEWHWRAIRDSFLPQTILYLNLYYIMGIETALARGHGPVGIRWLASARQPPPPARLRRHNHVERRSDQAD